MGKTVKKFWFFKSQELYDITKELEPILKLSEYYHDAEDTWEWCESCERNNELYFDISREHNDGHGIYKSPVILIINKFRSFEQSEIDVIGEMIAKKLDVEVFWGNVEWDRKLENNYESEYYYETISKYKAQNIFGLYIWDDSEKYINQGLVEVYVAPNNYANYFVITE